MRAQTLVVRLANHFLPQSLGPGRSGLCTALQQSAPHAQRCCGWWVVTGQVALASHHRETHTHNARLLLADARAVRHTGAHAHLSLLRAAAAAATTAGMLAASQRCSGCTYRWQAACRSACIAAARALPPAACCRRWAAGLAAGRAAMPWLMMHPSALANTAQRSRVRGMPPMPLPHATHCMSASLHALHGCGQITAPHASRCFAQHIHCQ